MTASLSWNVNGMRACGDRRFRRWLDRSDAEIGGSAEEARVFDFPLRVGDHPEGQAQCQQDHPGRGCHVEEGVNEAAQGDAADQDEANPPSTMILALLAMAPLARRRRP
jgi:uncharacterized protein (TIGR03382 family)